MEDINFIETVTERDIDLLILEEIHVSPVLCNWLVDIVVGKEKLPVTFVGAWHSLSLPGLGESDIVFKYRSLDNQERAILIENKIDASPQPEQGVRYIERGKIGIKRGHWAEFHTLIIAPEQYLSLSSEANVYDCQLSYEKLQDWFVHVNKESDNARIKYKVRMLDEAIQRNKRGYNPKIDEKKTQFFREYWQRVSIEFPELEIKDPGPKPSGSSWICANPNDLPKDHYIWHKFDVGHVDLEIKGAAEVISELIEKHESILPSDTEIVEIGKSVAIRTKVPPLDLDSSFEDQLENARAGMRAAYRLIYFSKIISSSGT